MKVLHFGRFHNAQFGGLERVVALLLKGLARSVEVTNLVANERFGTDVVEVDGYRIYRRLTYLHPKSLGGPLGPWEWSKDGTRLVAVHRICNQSQGYPWHFPRHFDGLYPGCQYQLEFVNRE